MKKTITPGQISQTNLKLIYQYIYQNDAVSQQDIDMIYENIDQISPFPETHDFIYISKMPRHNITFGSALPYIRSFLSGDLIF